MRFIFLSPIAIINASITDISQGTPGDVILPSDIIESPEIQDISMTSVAPVTATPVEEDPVPSEEPVDETGESSEEPSEEPPADDHVDYPTDPTDNRDPKIEYYIFYGILEDMPQLPEGAQVLKTTRIETEEDHTRTELNETEWGWIADGEEEEDQGDDIIIMEEIVQN